jgi:predicted PhzF superfamily epimerase YddE/YHI9
MTDTAAVLRYTAFDVDGEGGNPAGVVLDALGMDDTRMRQIAAGLGYSETAFLMNDEGADGSFRIRYLSLVWRETETIFHARDPFPPGGVVEDPATGAAAAAFGAYLRSLKLVTPPARVTIHQGTDMGRPSRLLVDVPAGDSSGIKVSGTAAPIDR